MIKIFSSFVNNNIANEYRQQYVLILPNPCWNTFFLRAIKISSPPINNLIIMGCFCLYASVIIYGFDTSSLSEDTFITICFVSVQNVYLRI